MRKYASFFEKILGLSVQILVNTVLLLFLIQQGLYWYLQLVLGLTILLYGARFYLKWKADQK